MKGRGSDVAKKVMETEIADTPRLLENTETETNSFSKKEQIPPSESSLHCFTETINQNETEITTTTTPLQLKEIT